MRICELLLDPRPHRVGHFGRNRRRRLIIEIDHAALARDAIRFHSSRKRVTSSSLVYGPKLTRIKPAATSSGTCIAASTSLAFIFPDEHALPAETAMPARSSWIRRDELEPPGSEIEPIVGIRGVSAAMTT